MKSYPEAEGIGSWSPCGPRRSPAGVISTSGLASTALSSGNISVTAPLKGLDPAGTPGARPFRRVLGDGTIVEGPPVSL